jgi:hypothetical protein
MPKLKNNFTKEVIYSINDSVQFDWIGQKDIGIVERIDTETRDYPIYFVRSNTNNRLYNMGADAGITTAGFIVGKTTSSKKPITKPTPAPVTQETTTESIELKKAIKKQKDFINHFFEV